MQLQHEVERRQEKQQARIDREAALPQPLLHAVRDMWQHFGWLRGEKLRRELVRAQELAASEAGAARRLRAELACFRGEPAALQQFCDLARLEELERGDETALASIRQAVAARRVAEAECSVCLSALKDTALVPCGHRLCQPCSHKLHECPLCKADIRERVRLY